MVGKQKSISFRDFLQIPFTYCTIDNHLDESKTIQVRIKNLKELINGGKLTSSQINILKRALSYDLPNSIKKLYKLDKKSKIKPIYEIYAKLWDYHHKELDNELGL